VIPDKRAERAYIVHRCDARKRGIEWQFTFSTWWWVWDDSGKWNERGRGAGKYVMARHGDLGPYAPANVRICTSAENLLESNARVTPAQVRGLRASAGTQREIAAHFGVSRSTVNAILNGKVWAGVR
jgi:DNA-binding XRE family transcriptional regulator